MDGTTGKPLCLNAAEEGTALHAGQVCNSSANCVSNYRASSGMAEPLLKVVPDQCRSLQVSVIGIKSPQQLNPLLWDYFFFPRTSQGETPWVIYLGPAVLGAQSRSSAVSIAVIAALGWSIPSSPGPHSRLLLQAFLHELPFPLLCFPDCTGVQQTLFGPLSWAPCPSVLPVPRRLLAFPSSPRSLALC